MYRWPWLEQKLREHPAVALLLLLFLVVTSAVVAVVAGDERGHRSGLPMQIVGIAGVLLFGYAAIKAVQRVRAQRDE